MCSSIFFFAFVGNQNEKKQMIKIMFDITGVKLLPYINQDYYNG